MNQHIRMISEGSCDTEDWSNAENSALHGGNKLLFKIYSNRKKKSIVIIFHIIAVLFLQIFDQINVALVRIRHFFNNKEV